MNIPSASLASRLLSAALLSAFAAIGAHAVPLTWDASGANPTAPTGGAGTWSSTNLNWSNGTSDVGWTSGTDNATFAGTSGGSVALGADITVNNITISTTGYTLAKDAGNLFTLTVNGIITNSQTGTITAKLGGSSGLTKAGAGTLVLNSTAANTYTGGTTVQSGTLQTRSAGALPTSTVVTIGSGTNAATLDVRASQTIAGLVKGGTGTSTISQSQTLGTTTLTINPSGAGVAAADSTFSGTVRDGDATHILALTKAGSNTLTLTGTNSYTGLTTVSGGTLKLGSSLGSNGVTVSGGTLAGNDSATNITLGIGAVSMSTGAIAPGGVGTAGSFTLGSAQNFSTTGGTLRFDLGSSYDQVFGSGGGTFSIASTTLDLGLLSGFSYGGTYTLFSGFGGGSSVGGLTITGYDTANWTASLANSGVLSFVSTSIPEPSSCALLAGGALLAASLVRRRKHA